MEAAWAPPHHAPPPSGYKDRAGLLRSPCSRRGVGRPGGVPRPFLHGDQQSSPLRNPLPGHAHLSRWHQGLWPRAHHPADRPPRQADQEAPLYAHGPRPCPRPQAAGPLWHHGVGDLRRWTSAGRAVPAGFRTPSGSQLWGVIQDSLRDSPQ